MMGYIKGYFTKFIKVIFLITLLVVFFVTSLEVALAQSLERQHESQLEIVAQARLGNIIQLKLLDVATGEFKVLTLDQNLQSLSETQAKLALTRERSRKFTGKLELDLAELVSRLRSKEKLFSFKGVVPEIMIPVVVWARTYGAIPKVNRVGNIYEEDGKGKEEESLTVFKDFNLKMTESLRKFVDESTLGLVKYQSRYAPILILDVSLGLLSELEQRDDVQAIFLSRTYNSDLDVSAKAIGADAVWARGITGNGVKVAVVEDGAIYFEHRGLKDGIYCNASHPDIDAHSSGVAGIISGIFTGGSTTYKGIAHGAPALLSGNAVSYKDDDIIACTDWAMNNGARVINMSFGNKWAEDSLLVIDRYVDYIVRYKGVTVVTSAGNVEPNDQGSCFTAEDRNYVTSPGKGWNVITVGSYYDQDTVDTNDDQIDFVRNRFCYLNPSSPHRDLEKPEVVAPGIYINTTLCTNWDGCFLNATGTSFAAAHVTGCAALLMDRRDSLKYWPEPVRAVLMASAIKNFEEDSPPDSSDRYYAAGGIRCDLADDIVQGSNGMESHGTYSENNFPITYTFRAYRTQDVRAVVVWNSDTGPFDRPWETDVLNANLDLKVFGPNGSLVGSSSSHDNSYEIVQFTANSTGTYTAQVDALRFDGDYEYLGFAVWKSPPPEDCSITGCPNGKICCPPRTKCISGDTCPGPGPGPECLNDNDCPGEQICCGFECYSLPECP